jgi:hypothetical protein
MDEVQELLEMARELTAASKPNIKGLYRKYNRSVFGGELPDDLPILWFKSKSVGGTCSGYWRRDGTSEATKIKISEYIAGDEDVVIGVLLHEMVHAYCLEKRLDKGHGSIFNSLRRKFGSKAGVDIPRKESIDHFEVPEDVQTKPMGVIVVDSPTGKGIATFGIKFFKSSLHRIVEKLEKYAKMYGEQGKHFDATLIQTESRDVMLYPEKRTFNRLETYRVDQGLINDIFNKGKELARVTSNEPTLMPA